MASSSFNDPTWPGASGKPATGAKAAVFTSARIKRHTDGKTIRKTAFVPGKPLNIVAN